MHGYTLESVSSGHVHSLLAQLPTSATLSKRRHGHTVRTYVFGDAGYQGVEKREENLELPVNWHIAMRPKPETKAMNKKNSQNHPELGCLPRYESLMVNQCFPNSVISTKAAIQLVKKFHEAGQNEGFVHRTEYISGRVSAFAEVMKVTEC